MQSMKTSLLLETVGRKLGNCDAWRGLCDRKLLQTIVWNARDSLKCVLSITFHQCYDLCLSIRLHFIEVF